ncbi:AAWKG family protein [Streptomyces anthocyanicus]|uniref:AAWKG family protein n=1 Tax=Streptomyces anthocyanicus TaxID=68174 RepID=UPI002F9105C7|nr:AAWKG family protein [Streptomyces anthocyanicus]
MPDANDYWGQAVTLFTGYPMPSRQSLFEKLKSKEGIPLMRVNLVEHETRAVDRDDYGYRTVSGWQKSVGEDYRIAFYATKGSNTKVTLYTADIVFIGILGGPDGKGHLSEGGSQREGGAFKGKYGDDWDDTDLWRYVTGSKKALNTLMVNLSTKGFSFGGTGVDDVNAVDLTSFERTAQSFDRVADFFRKHREILNEWETKRLGDEKAAWKGKSAGIMWNLVHLLNKNYESYVEQVGGATYAPKNGNMLGGYTPRSKHSDMLASAQMNLHGESEKLEKAWDAWAGVAQHDPHRSLLEVLDELVDWVIRNNVPYVYVGTKTPNSPDPEDLYSTENKNYEVVPPFQENAGFGNLDDINTWKKLGEMAIERWNKHIDEYLTPVAQQSIVTIGRNFSAAAEDVEDPLVTKITKDLSESYNSEQAKIEKDEAKDAAEKAARLNKEGFDSLGENFAAANAGNKELIDGISDASNNNQKLLNENLSGLSGSLNEGLSGIGDGFANLNPDTGGLNAPGGGPSTSPLNGGDIGGFDTGFGDGTSGPLNGGGTGDLIGPGGAFPVNPGNSLVTKPPTSSPLNGDSFGGLGPHLDDDGDLVTDFSDGSRSVFNPTTGQLTQTDPDGHSTTTQLNPGDVIANPDGGETRLNPDGTLTTEFPDGTSQVFDPSDGSLVTTNPDGTHTTTHLNHPDFNISPGPGSSQLNVPSGVNTPTDFGASPVNGPTSHAGSGVDGHYLDYDSTPFTGGTLGGPAGDLAVGADNGPASAAPGGMPLNPGMGGMGGGGAGGGAGGGSNGERVRNVLGGTGGASLRRPGSSGIVLDGEGLPLRRSGPATTSSGMPMGGSGAPMGGMQGSQLTETGDRERTSWVEEDEDVWGTDEGGAPAVIG